MPATANVNEIAFDAFGVRIGLSTNDPKVMERLREFVPPNAQPIESDDVQQRFEVRVGDGTYDMHFGKSWNLESHDLEFALGLVDMHMCGYMAVHSPQRIFVHAGVVAHEGQLIVIPGMSFAGKSSLVAGFIRAGATYYSDEFAPLDDDGRVHPYPKPVSLRDKAGNQTTHTAQSLGGSFGHEPLKPALVVVTAYRPGAVWDPRRLSTGEAVLAMLGNTVPARERPQESIRATRAAVEDAIVIQTDRGEADEAVPLILAELNGAG
jgi:hypothetical protein